MSIANTTTIGINLGARYTGIAVIVGTELRDWRVKVIYGKTLLEKFQCLTRILSRLLESYKPSGIVLKKPHPSRVSGTLSRLQLEAKAFLEQSGAPVLEYTLSQLKLRLLPGEKANKTKLIQFIVGQYPILLTEWEKECSVRRAYRVTMFEAVALAHVNRCCQQ